MSIGDYIRRRRVAKSAAYVLKTARHFVNLRGDLARPEDLKRIGDDMRSLQCAAAEGDQNAVGECAARLMESVRLLCPPRPWAALRENFEVLVVALAVAMAFRTFFVQPFKIPTSSMCPTLNGIHYIAQDRMRASDYFPLNIAKWIVFGQYYTELKASASGVAALAATDDGTFVKVGGVSHKVFQNMVLRVADGERVIRGQTIASGLKVAGDHIFVNKVRWQFLTPRRGEIMVFKTAGIKHPQIKTNEHYVKRMVGLPGERLGIVTPYLYVNGRVAAGSAMIEKIQSCAPGYNGYIQAGSFATGGVNAVELGPDEYFACGDNQRNSLDSRYWGPVPRKNLVGPAFFVYWPVSANWGPVR